MNDKNTANKYIIIFFIIIGILVFLFFWLPGHDKLLPPWMVCGTNMNLLGKVLRLYANDYDGKYPTPEKWCDLIKDQLGDDLERYITCPEVNDSNCYFAINPNCKLDSPGDMVLLFETKSGLNSYGGPELLTTKNHKKGGCNICFNDGHVEFVKEEEIGDLKWSDEENNE